MAIKWANGPPNQSLLQSTRMIEIFKLATDPKQALLDIKQRRGNFAHYHFFGKELLFIADWKSVKTIMELEGNGKIGRDALYEAKKPTFGDGLFNSQGETWTTQRRMIQPFFSKKGIEQWEEIICRTAINTANKLGNLTTGTEIDLSIEFKSLIQNILIGVMFGSNDSEFEFDPELVRSIDRIVEGLFPSFLAEVLGHGYFRHLFFLQNKRTENAIRYFQQYVIERADIEKDGALVTLLANTRDRTGCPMAQNLLLDESITIFLAGQDSTVNTLIWLFYLLGRHPAVFSRLTHELNQIEEAIGFDQLNNLPYAKAVLYETMRLYPQAISLARDAERDVIVNGKPVKTGSALIISIYAMHRDPLTWKNPDEFIPERFLGELTEDQKGSFMPFGAGIHNCIGKHFAEAEILVLMATILRHVELNISNQAIDSKISITLKPGKPLRANKL